MIKVINLVEYYPGPVGIDAEEMMAKILGEKAIEIESHLNSLDLEGDATVIIEIQDGNLAVGVESDDLELKKKIRDSILI